MNEEEKIQWMEDYLYQRLTPEQSLVFQQQLKDDPDFRKEVELHQLLLKGITLESKVSQFREHLHTLREEVPVITINTISETPRATILLWRWVASVAAVLLIGLLYFWYAQPPTNEALFAQYYQPYRGSVLATVLRGDSVLTLEKKAIQAYDNHRYQQAIPLLEQVVQQREGNVNWRFYLGIAYLEVGQLNKAVNTLHGVAQNPQGLFQKQAQWYLALAYLKQNQTGQARKTLQALTKQPGVYAEKAAQLLSEL
jgi:predicted Zn-dependent protease